MPEADLSARFSVGRAKRLLAGITPVPIVSRGMVLVPVERLRHLGFCLGADEQGALHRRALIRSWTACQGDPSWDYDRISGALANLGIELSDQTVGNVLQRHGISPTPERVHNSTWHEFIRQHRETLWACDFFTSEVWTRTGLTTSYILFIRRMDAQACRA